MSRSSQRSTIKDMTNGSPAKLILGFAVPMLMGLLFQQFYSLVDTLVIGRVEGVTALAAVSAAAELVPPMWLLSSPWSASAKISPICTPTRAFAATASAQAVSLRRSARQTITP